MRLKLGMELIFAGFFLATLLETSAGNWCKGCMATVSFLSNNTTLPPLSPVAR